MNDELKPYGLKLSEADGPDRQAIDFEIMDGHDAAAWVWGDDLSDTSLDWECNHPSQCLVFGDRDEQGECALCGSYCDWLTTPDSEGHATPEPYEWYPRRTMGGLLGEYIEKLRAVR